MTSGCRAAVDVAEQLGYRVNAPVLVQETNNTVVWLRPHEIIAKVATRPDSVEGVVREHRLASALDRLGASVAPPLPEVGPCRHPPTGFVVTLWQRLAHDPDTDLRDARVASSLRGLHDALAGCDVELPSFWTGLHRAREALFDDRRLSALSASDRVFLRSAFDGLTGEVRGRRFGEGALHGEPHTGNYLITPAGLRWIDFEAACRGPLEWDLAFLAP